MAEQEQKSRKSKTVRIWLEPKKRLQKVLVEKAYNEKRTITEAEIVSKAVETYCKKEERKLGITQ